MVPSPSFSAKPGVFVPLSFLTFLVNPPELFSSSTNTKLVCLASGEILPLQTLAVCREVEENWFHLGCPYFQRFIHKQIVFNNLSNHWLTCKQYSHIP